MNLDYLEWKYDTARNSRYMNHLANNALSAHNQGWIFLYLLTASSIVFVCLILIDAGQPYLVSSSSLSLTFGALSIWQFCDALNEFDRIKEDAWFIKSSGSRLIKTPDGVTFNCEYAEYSQGLKEGYYMGGIGSK